MLLFSLVVIQCSGVGKLVSAPGKPRKIRLFSD